MPQVITKCLINQLAVMIKHLKFKSIISHLHISVLFCNGLSFLCDLQMIVVFDPWLVDLVIQFLLL